ncbi:hypothetical protein GOP47_0022965 [Adiantum capillus-veneris]|uniref:non-specific serine/threonine protein kinase n=1 Tax=Adiantum capillus-veneris TaxID=13818 RepID=A0A9D4Z7D8_ADICA|nr:hypothetical protein GOP47_0022965 [Adiantum capillus-veneris]
MASVRRMVLSDACYLQLLAILLLHFLLLSTTSSNEEGNLLIQVKDSLIDSRGALRSWNKDVVDPCLDWIGITCDNSQVTRVVLPMEGLSGTLSKAIGSLQQLQVLIIRDNMISGHLPRELGSLSQLNTLLAQNNRFDGVIPSSLGNLGQLKTLDLSGNNLSGQIPSTFFKLQHYNFSGNHLDCDSNFPEPCESPNTTSSSRLKKSSSTGAIVGGVLGSAAFIFCISVFIIYCERRCRHEKQNRQEVFVDVPAEDDLKIAFGQLKRFSWRELQRATDDFSESNVIGQGAFAKVYKGVLNDNSEIAVKRLLSISPDIGEASFLQEVEMISVAVHRNLLLLLGFCITPSERILVYPFMQNKSVAYRLRDRRNGEPALEWNTRKRIALGAARGLEYLHHQCSRKIIHRDVKAANVLLNSDYEAVVGDFGLAKLVDTRNTHVTTMVRGTMGHIAPEYLSTGKSSEKTDVFGYGIMLLEFVTGQRAIDLSRLQEEDDVLLLDHVKKLQHEKRLDMIVDPELTDYNPQEVEQMIQVALLCAQGSPEDRPSMEEVVRMLSGEGLAERWEEWQQVEVIRRREYEAMPHRLAEWVEDSTVNQEAIQLSAAR